MDSSVKQAGELVTEKHRADYSVIELDDPGTLRADVVRHELIGTRVISVEVAGVVVIPGKRGKRVHVVFAERSEHQPLRSQLSRLSG